MAASTSHSAASSENAPRAFFRARLGSIVAIVPLAVWLFFHLWNNLSAFQAGTDGGAAWQAAVTEYSSPFSQLASFIIVLLPIVIHTVWGIGRLLTSRPNNIRYGFFANFKYLLQRLAAIGILLFLGAHLWLAMLDPRFNHGHAEHFDEISHEMRWHLPTLLVYLLGTLGVAYHLGNGVQTFAMGWGLVGSRRALRRMNWVAWAIFVLFLAMSWAVIYAMYTNAPPK